MAGPFSAARSPVRRLFPRPDGGSLADTYCLPSFPPLSFCDHSDFPSTSRATFELVRMVPVYRIRNLPSSSRNTGSADFLPGAGSGEVHFPVEGHPLIGGGLFSLRFSPSCHAQFCRYNAKGYFAMRLTPSSELSPPYPGAGVTRYLSRFSPAPYNSLLTLFPSAGSPFSGSFPAAFMSSAPLCRRLFLSLLFFLSFVESSSVGVDTG